jgi:hypothetical protein
MNVGAPATRLGRGAPAPVGAARSGRGGFGSARSAGTSSLVLATKLGAGLLRPMPRLRYWQAVQNVVPGKHARRSGRTGG